MANWVNMVFYQATWIASVAGAGRRLWWPGLAVLVAFAAWQIAVSRWRRADLALAIVVSLVGFAIDSSFLRLGLMNFAAPDVWPAVAPPWLIALWTSFALALNHSLGFLHGRPLAAALLGGIGAPLAYWAAGSGWHALTLGERPALTLALTGAIWAMLMPGFSRLALQWRRFDAPAGAGGAA